MRAINVTTQQEISSNLLLADTIISRMKGLLGRDTMPADMALWIKPCKGVHTFGMKFSIDVIYLDKNNTVIALEKNLRPNKMTRVYLKAASVIELPENSIDLSKTAPGNKIEIL